MMDNLNWDTPATSDVLAVQPCLSDYGIICDFNEYISNHDRNLQGIQTFNSISGFDRVSERVQQLAPNLNSTKFASNMKSGANWGEASTSELCSSTLINSPYFMNPFNGLVANFDTIGHSHTKSDDAGAPAMASIEFLGCLLSTTNSNTDTSVEEDGISMILSDCGNLLNFGSNGGAISSSGESENNGSNGRRKEKELQINEPIEEVSRSSSKNLCVNNGKSPLEFRPSSKKRSKNQQEPKGDVDYHYFDLLQSNSSTIEGGFRLISENPQKSKKPRFEKHQKSSNINFQQPNSSVSSVDEPDTEAIAQMKEMIFRAAAFRPVNLGFEAVEKPKRKNVRISSDPQTVAARQRRERIGERIRVLQRLVPGGSKMDTASMLDEAANYLKFLKSQIKTLETLGGDSPQCNNIFSMQTLFPFPKP